MRRRIERLARSRPLLPALALVSVSLLGCRSQEKVVATGPSQYELRDAEFRQQLVLSTGAINDGNLDQARTYLTHAREAAWKRSQDRKVDDLEHLITGAEALMTGDAEATSVAWAQIDDAALGNEVNAKAGAIGVTVEQEANP